MKTNPADDILAPVPHQQKVVQLRRVPELGAIQQQQGGLCIEGKELEIGVRLIGPRLYLCRSA